MKFSFIAFTFGNGRLDNLELTLKSCEKYRDDKDVEYIVMELNGNHAEELAKKYNFKFYRHDTESKGLRSVGRNVGVLYAKGDYVILHDNDVVIDKYFFDDVKCYARKYHYFANYSDVYSMSKNFTEKVMALPDEEQHFGYEFDRVKPYFDNVRHFGYRPTTIVAPHGGSFTIRKDLYLKVGGFDPIFQGWGSEDSDFRFRVLCTMQNLNKYGIIKKDLIHSWHPYDYDAKSKSKEKNNIENSKIFANRVYKYSQAMGRDYVPDWNAGGLTED